MAELALSEIHSGGQFDLRVGDLVVITLAEGAGGYRWSVVELDKSFLALEHHHFHPGSDVGGNGSAEWQLRAKREGRTTIELKKARAWEATQPVAQFSASLDIRRA